MPYTLILALLAIWIAVYIVSLFLLTRNYGIEVTPIYMLFRTETFNRFLSKIAENNKIFWHTFSNVGVAIAAVEMLFVIYYLASNLQRFFWIPVEAQPVVPILPGITVGFEWFP